jgi:DNA repair protein RadC
MDRETLLSWLALAERHVKEGAHHLLEQRELLARLQTHGHSKSETARIARDLLDTMEQAQAQHIDSRDRLMATLKS